MKAGGNSYLSAPLLTLGGNVKIEYGDSLNVSESDLILADDQISGDKINGGTIDTITITDLNIKNLVDVARNGYKVELSNESISKINDCRELVESKINAGEIMYGINTGIGEFSETILNPFERLSM